MTKLRKSGKSKKSTPSLTSFFKIAIHSDKRAPLVACCEGEDQSQPDFFVWDGGEITKRFEHTAQAKVMRDAHPTYNASKARLNAVGKAPIDPMEVMMHMMVLRDEAESLRSLLCSREYNEARMKHSMARSKARHAAIKLVLKHYESKIKASGKKPAIVFGKSAPRNRSSFAAALKRSCQLRGPRLFVTDDIKTNKVCHVCHERLEELYNGKNGALLLFWENEEGERDEKADEGEKAEEDKREEGEASNSNPDSDADSNSNPDSDSDLSNPRKDIQACMSKTCLDKEKTHDKQTFVVREFSKNHAANMAYLVAASERPKCFEREWEYEDFYSDVSDAEESTDTEDEHCNSEWWDSQDEEFMQRFA